jgi:hypothetical protein
VVTRLPALRVRKGREVFSSLRSNDKEPRQLTGKKSEPEKEKAEASDKPKDDTAKDADKDKTEKEKFNVVRLSPKGDWLIVSNKEGLWLMHGTTGAQGVDRQDL